MYWLIDRWCKVHWTDQATLTTPKGRTHKLSCWNELPYLTRSQLERVLADLPAATTPGRSGKCAGTKVASSCIILGPTACAVRFPTDSVAAERADENVHETRRNGTNKEGRQAIRSSLQHLIDDERQICVEQNCVKSVLRPPGEACAI